MLTPFPSTKFQYSIIPGITSALAALTSWLCAFIVIQFYGTLRIYVGDAWCYWILAIICAHGAVFVFLFVPETKGRNKLNIYYSLITVENNII